MTIKAKNLPADGVKLVELFKYLESTIEYDPAYVYIRGGKFLEPSDLVFSGDIIYVVITLQV